MALCLYHAVDGTAGWGWVEDKRVYALQEEAVLEAISRGDTIARLASTLSAGNPIDGQSVRFAAPMLPTQEVWAAGVTYESSKFARMAESADGGDFYAKVYVADRPELFMKATPNRVSGHGEAVCIRSDSAWNVPEPELAVLISSAGRVLGYTVGNDMSSRDIEGANPLYLPQAKVYRKSCALGPWIVPAESVDVSNLRIGLNIERDRVAAFEGETSTSRMRRSPDELASWLFKHNDFPTGVMLLTGTGVVPPDSFTLQSGDTVEIEIEGIGVLRNHVEMSL